MLTLDGTAGITYPNGTLQAQARPDSPQSMVRVNTANGFGSTQTQVRRFTNVVTNQGNDITYNDDAANGATFTINTNGVYSISYSDQLNASLQNIGVTLNSTASLGSSATPILCGANTSAANVASCASGGFYLPAGSIIRAMATAPSGTSTTFCQFTITRVA